MPIVRVSGNVASGLRKLLAEEPQAIRCTVRPVLSSSLGQVHTTWVTLSHFFPSGRSQTHEDMDSVHDKLGKRQISRVGTESSPAGPENGTRLARVGCGGILGDRNIPCLTVVVTAHVCKFLYQPANVY